MAAGARGVPHLWQPGRAACRACGRWSARAANLWQSARGGCQTISLCTLLLIGCSRARADPSVELSGAAGFGVLAVGVTPARFAVSPSASVSLRGEGWFFVARDTASFLGATGGRFGIHNEITFGGGLFGELVNVSAGLSLAQLSLPICGPRLCGQVRALAPGADVRLDVFGPYLSGSLGISFACAGSWITGDASPVWSGVSVRCSAGPVFRFAPHS